MTKNDIRIMRKELELTQKYVSEELNVTQGLISHFECGRVSLDSICGKNYEHYITNMFFGKYPSTIMGLLALSEAKKYYDM